ncbi:aspartate aminotransferase family protein [Actinomyces sp. 2119]|uniref:daptide-type RiPP biosynthesis aminotransferase n=1 Tax=Actinomyces sp. 2119 TaxID=2321393 RepID=UPI000E6CAA9F|nr:daptide-type RiPP biosynthesis aminotransferase [Actinomyces sp. 2119]RJF43799.1 aspartate aminotransferase family protein [Actinomyces sp. 2119]
MRTPASTGFTAQFFVSPSQQSLSPPLASARGTTVTYADGTRCRDGISGLWNVPLGYGHAGVAEAVHQALLDASYLTCFRGTHTWVERASKALLDAAGAQNYRRVAHATSGSAAVDSAIKLVRQYQAVRGEGLRRTIISLKGSYHGMTLGAMSLTGESLRQVVYGTDARAVRHVDHRRPRELEHLLEREGSRIAAVVVEPLQGSGAHVVGDDFLSVVFQGRRQHGYLVVADEVATGFGRTGPMFASQSWTESPDLLITSKGLTNGTQAASAVLVSHQVVQTFDDADSPFMHGETQAGTPASCAAILATLRAFDEDDVLAQGRRVHAQLDGRLQALVERAPGTTCTGSGCFRAVHLPDASGAEVARIIERCRLSGAIVQPGPSSLQLVPALVYEPCELDLLMDRVEDVVVASCAPRGAVVA